jgi:hypothetical protein
MPTHVVTGVETNHPGGFARTDLETCACGATRTTLIITPVAPGNLEELPTVIPGMWDRP